MKYNSVSECLKFIDNSFEKIICPEMNLFQQILFLFHLLLDASLLASMKKIILSTLLILPMLLEMTITSPEFHRTFASILRASRSSFQSVWTKQYLCLMHAIRSCYNLHHMKKLPLLSQRHKDQYRWGGYVCSACLHIRHGFMDQRWA